MAEETTPSTTKPPIVFDDFARVDLRVARVLEAENHPSADRLIVLKLDDGSGATRQICAGIRGHYEAADLVGKSVVVVANLAPRTLRGVESQGMLLAASEAGDGGERRVIVLSPAGAVAPGSVVS
jgi:methionyl-tRNA synthetase